MRFTFLILTALYAANVAATPFCAKLLAGLIERVQPATLEQAEKELSVLNSYDGHPGQPLAMVLSSPEHPQRLILAVGRISALQKYTGSITVRFERSLDTIARSIAEELSAAVDPKITFSITSAAEFSLTNNADSLRFIAAIPLPHTFALPPLSDAHPLAAIWPGLQEQNGHAVLVDSSTGAAIPVSVTTEARAAILAGAFHFKANGNLLHLSLDGKAVTTDEASFSSSTQEIALALSTEGKLLISVTEEDGHLSCTPLAQTRLNY